MSKKILIVRTSSLGDLVHILPAISDISQHVPDAQIDWIVEDSFTEIPGWHDAINQVIPVSHRKWRKNWWSKQTRQQRHALKQDLSSRKYDIILDMQGLMKSIWLVRQTNGLRHGLNLTSAREPLASFFYKIKHKVKFWQPAVTRQRLLASLALGYTYSGPPDYGLQKFINTANIQPYAVIMPSASRDDKLWAQSNWHLVFKHLQNLGLAIKVVSGNDIEIQRAKQLAQGFDNIEIMPRMNLTNVAELIASSSIMIGLDSGITHLSAGLSRPTIAIYIASTPLRTPLQGVAYTASLGERGNPPSAQTILAAINQALNC